MRLADGRNHAPKSLTTFSGGVIQHKPSPFHVVPFDRRLLQSQANAPGYNRYLNGAPSCWMGATTFTWNFGDGTEPVEIRDHLSATHRYERPGTYTLTVSARDVQGAYVSGSKQVVVVNQSPNLQLAVSAMPGETQSFVFHAANIVVRQEPDESLSYAWEFGDGEKLQGQQLTRVIHQYQDPGQYTVVVKATDTHGGSDSSREKVVVRAPGNLATPTGPASETPPSAVDTAFKASMHGTFAAQLDAEIDVIAAGAIHYLVSKKGGVCDFKFSFEDPGADVSGYLSLTVKNLTNRGGRFFVHNPRIMMSFKNRKQVLRTQDATAEIEIVPGQYATGTVKARLRHYKRTSKVMVPQADFVDLDGEFSIDLFAHQSGFPLGAPPLTDPARAEDQQRALDNLRRNLFSVSQCERGFGIVRHWPSDGTEHLPHARPSISVKFDDEIDPTTVSADTFQVGYRNAAGKFVPETGQYLINSKRISFVPERALLAGVRYLAQIKSGEDGIASAAGVTLDSTGDDSWYRWRFTTQLDFAAADQQDNGLFCHVYQSSRDVPLIAGKPAVARVYARWSGHDDVLPKDQSRGFDASIVIGEHDAPIAVGQCHFYRPDEYKAFAIDQAKAEHTAQLPFTPSPKVSASQPVSIRAGKSGYATNCPVRNWAHAPTLTVDVFRMLSDDSRMHVDRVLATRFVKDVERYAWQLLPFKRVIVNGPFEIAAPQVLPSSDAWSPGLFMEGYENIEVRTSLALGSGEEVTYRFPGYQKLLKTPLGRNISKADIVVVLGPHELFGGGADTQQTLVKTKQGFVAATLGADGGLYPRYVNGLVHEFGHVLLGAGNHLPDPGNSMPLRDAVAKLRDSGAPLWFQGIEGYRMSSGGQSGSNMSSVEGNPLSNSVSPLMFPGTRPENSAFIMDHHYRKIQALYSKRAGGR